MLYVGSTEDLLRRIWQHKEKEIEESFTAKHGINQLWYYEAYNNLFDAREREYQIKKWRRSKKINLIESRNPTYLDIADEWFDEVK